MQMATPQNPDAKIRRVPGSGGRGYPKNVVNFETLGYGESGSAE